MARTAGAVSKPREQGYNVTVRMFVPFKKGDFADQGRAAALLESVTKSQKLTQEFINSGRVIRVDASIGTQEKLGDATAPAAGAVALNPAGTTDGVQTMDNVDPTKGTATEAPSLPATPAKAAAAATPPAKGANTQSGTAKS